MTLWHHTKAYTYPLFFESKVHFAWFGEELRNGKLIFELYGKDEC